MERWRDGSEVEFSAHVDEQIPGAHEANLQRYPNCVQLSARRVLLEMAINAEANDEKISISGSCSTLISMSDMKET